MNERELHDAWERELKKRHGVQDRQVLDQIWEDLVNQGYVAVALTEPETALKNLLYDTQIPLKYWRLGSRRRAFSGSLRAPKEVATQPSSSERVRAEAFSEYIATLAEGNRDVQHFRQLYLDNCALTPDEAYALLGSPASQYLDLYKFKTRDIPIVGHRSRILSSRQSPTPARSWFLELTLRIEWQGGEYEGTFTFRESRLTSGGPPSKSLHFPDIKRQVLSEVPVWRGSILDELRQLSDSLTEIYPWKKEDATWFALTGAPPWIPPLTGQASFPSGPGFEHGSITLTIAPWVSAETVKRSYLDIQRQILVRRKQRQPSKRNVAVFRFVTEHTEARAPEERPWDRKLIRPTWRKLLEEWNQMYAEGDGWHYKRVWNFQRDFTRAWLALAYLDYKLPQDGSA